MQHVRNVVCTADTTTAEKAACDDRMLWLLGKDVTGENADFPEAHPRKTEETRWSFGDVVHASPVVVTYGFKDVDPDGSQTYEPNGVLDSDDTLIDKMLAATNEGGLRMVDAVTGMEDWIFMPKEILLNQDALYTGGEAPHIYGIDSTPLVRVVDNNGNGSIEPQANSTADDDFEDKVYAYFGMRRGGQNIYALDITPSATLTSSATVIEPKFQWRISGGSGDFVRLADTWSKPTLATIKVRTTGNSVTTKDVLVFAGGYDDSLDGADINGSFGTASSNPNTGNAIYIVDADTGDRLFWVGHAGYVDGATTVTTSGADIVHADMRHSIPAQVSVIDTNGDSVHDRLYVGDTGGQIWRIDLGDDIKEGGGLSSHPSVTNRTVLGKMASISTAGTAVEERRFFSKVDPVLVIDTKYSDVPGGKYTYVVATTGYRAHPLNSSVNDRLYAFRDLAVGAMPDTVIDHHADVATYPTITDSDMIDISNSPNDKLDSTNTSHKSSYGYYITFPDSGEKGITPTITLLGKVFFSTYSPNMTAGDACSANIGTSYGWAISLATGEGFESSTVSNSSGRRTVLGAGLASDPLPLFTKDGVKIVAGLQQSLKALSGNLSTVRERTFWYEEPY